MITLIDKLARIQSLDLAEYVSLLQNWGQPDAKYAFAQARLRRESRYGKDIFLRGLIEISNYCQNDCYYCGIRKSNLSAVRYRLNAEQILACCRKGYALGLRTFVLQGGDDPYYTDALVCGLISAIKDNWPDCAVTLSLGEKSRGSYAAFRQAGADRYLLRHETADTSHYAKLHPPALRLSNRKRCLYDLKELGFQVGAGFMVGSPGQGPKELAQDLKFLEDLQPHMVGIGPFIPHRNTPFAAEQAGSAELTLFLLALTRLLLPEALLPATTALGSVAKNGWERGVLAGANVIMPNLTPATERTHYLLYDHKNTTAAEESAQIVARMSQIGYRVVTSRGDAHNF